MIARGCLLWLAVAAASPAAAQVIEIGADGAATLYDRPMTFSFDAATPISPPAAPASGLAEAARAQGLPAGLIEAVAWRESRGRQDAVSAKGALGVMQLMPATAAELGVDPRDAADNIRGGATYLRRQIDRFGSIALGLAAYNAGPGAVTRFGGIPPYAETRAYVSAILARWRPEAVVPPTNPLLIEATVR